MSGAVGARARRHLARRVDDDDADGVVVAALAELWLWRFRGLSKRSVRTASRPGVGRHVLGWGNVKM